MRMTITRTIRLEEIVCGTCGIQHAVPQDWISARREESGDIHCPNGCCRTWKESNADRLRKQLEIRERELREAKCETLRQSLLKDEAAAAREKAEKKLRRVKNGVCPCCNRSFTNLARHMATKHGKHQKNQAHRLPPTAAVARKGSVSKTTTTERKSGAADLDAVSPNGRDQRPARRMN